MAFCFAPILLVGPCITMLPFLYYATELDVIILTLKQKALSPVCLNTEPIQQDHFSNTLRTTLHLTINYSHVHMVDLMWICHQWNM